MKMNKDNQVSCAVAQLANKIQSLAVNAVNEVENNLSNFERVNQKFNADVKKLSDNKVSLYLVQSDGKNGKSIKVDFKQWEYFNQVHRQAPGKFAVSKVAETIIDVNKRMEHPELYAKKTAKQSKKVSSKKTIVPKNINDVVDTIVILTMAELDPNSDICKLRRVLPTLTIETKMEELTNGILTIIHSDTEIRIECAGGFTAIVWIDNRDMNEIREDLRFKVSTLLKAAYCNPATCENITEVINFNPTSNNLGSDTTEIRLLRY